MIRIPLRMQFGAALLGTALAHPAAAQMMTMPTQATIAVGVQQIQVEVASTPQQLATGLMGRRSLPDGHGMLFVFGRTQRVCMWMKNTLIPLSVAFIDSHGNVVNVDEMQPQTLTPHCGMLPVAYALEMPAGWFTTHRVGRGARLRGAPFGTPLQR
ncbi:hypothetical protein GALL_448730 [mine drainage metagenome]|jgi:uncharacterized membrane protein (UPF0127 family)|uniref:Secreted protein containing DUF192 n=1 Tax=mine drainage metagenome TaxID=410659 RepID=A0A1J5PPS1_9ZZZZ